MWLRCQIGSKRPLAKRKARMFCAASLPRKWSMRKICSSSKTSCSSALSARGAREVGAERLLHDDPAALDQPGLGELVHDRRAPPWAAPRGSAAAARPRRGSPRTRRPRPGSLAAQRCPAPSGCARRTRAGRRRSRRGCECSRIEANTRSRNSSRLSSSSEVATTRRPSSSCDSCRCSMPGSSLRLARSPVAPKRTTVVAGMGPEWRRSGASGRCVLAEPLCRARMRP